MGSGNKALGFDSRVLNMQIMTLFMIADAVIGLFFNACLLAINPYIKKLKII